MLRLLAVITAAAARPENATYFDVASSLWPPTTAAGRCLAQQRKYGFHPKPKGSNFKTLGTEGVGHHWLEGLPRRLCGGGCRGCWRRARNRSRPFSEVPLQAQASYVAGSPVPLPFPPGPPVRLD